MTAASPPEAELSLSRQGHQSKNEFTFGKGDLVTAAPPPPEVDLTLSTQGH